MMFRKLFLSVAVFFLFHFPFVYGMRQLVRRNTTLVLNCLGEARQGLQDLARETEACCGSCVSLCEVCNPLKSSCSALSGSLCCGFSLAFGSVFSGLFFLLSNSENEPLKTEAFETLKDFVSQNETVYEFCRKLIDQ